MRSDRIVWRVSYLNAHGVEEEVEEFYDRHAALEAMHSAIYGAVIERFEMPRLEEPNIMPSP